MNPVRVAIVGCGRIADLHEMGYRGRDDARIVAVCDTNRKLAEKRAQGVGRREGLHRLQPAPGRRRDRPGGAAGAAPPARRDDGGRVSGGQARLRAEADGAQRGGGGPDDRGGGAGEGRAARLRELRLLPAARPRQADDRGRRDRRAADDPPAREHGQERHGVEGAARRVGVALRRVEERRRPAGLRPRLPPLLAGPLSDGRCGAGLRLD